MGKVFVVLFFIFSFNFAFCSKVGHKREGFELIYPGRNSKGVALIAHHYIVGSRVLELLKIKSMDLSLLDDATFQALWVKSIVLHNNYEDFEFFLRQRPSVLTSPEF